MSRSFIHLRRALFGVSCAIVFGFGASEALAAPEPAQYGACQMTGYVYFPPDGVCPEDCSNGYCDGYNSDCVCW